MKKGDWEWNGKKIWGLGNKERGMGNKTGSEGAVLMGENGSDGIYNERMRGSWDQ